jgi:hypothetical protein
MRTFLERLSALPHGYSEGVFGATRYGVTLTVSPDGKRVWLFGEELGGNDRISFNLYHLSSGEHRLKPCEMSPEKVTAFVLEYTPKPRATGYMRAFSAKRSRKTFSLGSM